MHFIKFSLNQKLTFSILDSQNDDDRKLFVGSLAQEANEKDITEYFESFGEVILVDLKRNWKGRSRRFAFVVFKDVETLNKVLAKQGHMIKGQKVFVAKAKPPGSAESGGLRGGFRGRGKLRGSFRGRGGYSDRGGFRGGFRGRGRAGHHVQLVQNFY